MENIQKVDFSLIFEKAIRSEITGYIGKRYLVSVVATKTLDIESNSSNSLGPSQVLPYAERKI